MSPDQLAQEQETEKRLGIAAAIVARCTGCGRGYTTTAPFHDCTECGEAVECLPYVKRRDNASFAEGRDAS